MNKPHAMHDFSSSDAGVRKGLVRSWVDFWFAPTDPLGFHVVRFLAGLLFFCWLTPFAANHEAFFGLGGWFDIQAYREASRLPESTAAPLDSWSILYWVRDANPALLTAIYWSSVVVLVLFTLGVAPQVTAVLAWLIVASYTANPAISYDADVLLIVLAFYLMIGYLLFALPRPGQRWSFQVLVPPISWFVGRTDPERENAPSTAGNLTLRLLQVHFALIICTSGFHKLQLAEWWSGAAFWYPLHPPFETTLAQAREQAGNATTYLSVLSLAAYLTLAWQITYPVYAWRPRWRIVLLGGAVIGWLGCAFLYKLPLFGPAILIGSLCFLTPAEWRMALAWLSRLPGLHGLAQSPEDGERPASSRPTRKEAAATASRTR